jgi:hypothetical protein
MAIVVLWTQFGDRIGLPSWHVTASRTAEQRQHEFHWNRVLDAGLTIEVKGINGSVTAEKAAGDQVEVVALKIGKRNDPREVRIEVVEHSGGVTICAVYPGASRSANSCESSGRRISSDVQVRFSVRVPRGVRLVARTVNGSVKATDLESDLVAQTVNGSIRLSTSGRAEAKTVNGSIRVEIGSTDLSDNLEFSTVNGSITVYVPDGLNADIGASTVGGRLSSDFPLRIERKQMHGMLGSGGHELKLSAVNGTIQLRRAR